MSSIDGADHEVSLIFTARGCENQTCVKVTGVKVPRVVDKTEITRVRCVAVGDRRVVCSTATRLRG